MNAICQLIILNKILRCCFHGGALGPFYGTAYDGEGSGN